MPPTDRPSPHAAEATDQVMPRVGGKPFRCDCGCNVFTRRGDRYTCNGCRTNYIGEGAAPAPPQQQAPPPIGRMTVEERSRLRKLAESLKSADSTGGNLEGVLAVALLDVLDDLDDLSPVPPPQGLQQPPPTEYDGEVAVGGLAVELGLYKATAALDGITAIDFRPLAKLWREAAGEPDGVPNLKLLLYWAAGRIEQLAAAGAPGDDGTSPQPPVPTAGGGGGDDIRDALAELRNAVLHHLAWAEDQPYRKLIDHAIDRATTILRKAPDKPIWVNYE